MPILILDPLCRVKLVYLARPSCEDEMLCFVLIIPVLDTVTDAVPRTRPLLATFVSKAVGVIKSIQPLTDTDPVKELLPLVESLQLNVAGAASIDPLVTDKVLEPDSTPDIVPPDIDDAVEKDIVFPELIEIVPEDIVNPPENDLLKPSRFIVPPLQFIEVHDSVAFVKLIVPAEQLRDPVALTAPDNVHVLVPALDIETTPLPVVSGIVLSQIFVAEFVPPKLME